jgi:hypothetical protein
VAGVTEPISVRARFERFPATVKGAFIFRGEDRDPHQVVFGQARVVPVGGGAAHEVPVRAVTLDVVPHRDLFVPFELATIDLEPGWYRFECDLEVDGSLGTFDGGSRFSVAWPRATVRRGTIKVGRRVALGSASVTLEQIDCAGDSIRLQLRVEPPGELSVRLRADDRRVDVLELELDAETGKGKVVAFPLLRTDATVRVELKGRGRASATIEVPLG